MLQSFRPAWEGGTKLYGTQLKRFSKFIRIAFKYYVPTMLYLSDKIILCTLYYIISRVQHHQYSIIRIFCLSFFKSSTIIITTISALVFARSLLECVSDIVNYILFEVIGWRRRFTFSRRNNELINRMNIQIEHIIQEHFDWHYTQVLGANVLIIYLVRFSLKTLTASSTVNRVSSSNNN